MQNPKILVTAFSPMGEWQQNSSEILITSLQQELPCDLISVPTTIQFAVIPAKLNELRSNWNELLAKYRPDVFLFFGQAKGRTSVSLERFALNCLDFKHPDANGDISNGKDIEENGPLAYRSSVDTLPEIAERLLLAGIPASVSNHAGTSLCNYLYYTALHEIALSGRTGKALFVHVPVVHEQVIAQWPDTPSLSLPVLRQAVAIIILELLAAAGA